MKVDISTEKKPREITEIVNVSEDAIATKSVECIVYK